MFFLLWFVCLLDFKYLFTLLISVFVLILISSESVPKKILEFMNVPGLTRENVASHLQVLSSYHHLCL